MDPAVRGVFLKALWSYVERVLTGFILHGSDCSAQILCELSILPPFGVVGTLIFDPIVDSHPNNTGLFIHADEARAAFLVVFGNEVFPRKGGGRQPVVVEVRWVPCHLQDGYFVFQCLSLQEKLRLRCEQESQRLRDWFVDPSLGGTCDLTTSPDEV